MDPNWDSECSNQSCFGVPLYRTYLTGTEKGTKNFVPEFIRMAGMNICQRETMSVNHGHYYVDLTADRAKQDGPLSGLLPRKRNIFIGDKKYDFFLVYGKDNTEQTYQMYVGEKGFDPNTDVKLIRAHVENAPFTICAENDDRSKCKESVIGGDGKTLKTSYDSGRGLLTVTLNLSAFAEDFKSAAEGLCVPESFCQISNKQCVGKPGGLGNLTQAERDITCGRAGEDVDCPKGGCVGFQIKLPADFKANNQTNAQLVQSLATCFPKDPNWDVKLSPAKGELANGCVGDNAPMNADFCAAQ